MFHIPDVVEDMKRTAAEMVAGVRVKKARQNKNLEPGSDSIRTGLY
jgi:hypothetical protein